MKYAVLPVAVLLLASSWAALALAQEPAGQTVSVAMTTAAVRETPSTRADVLLLWNRNERVTPIGHALKTCVKSGQGGISGGGVMNCTLSISLPLGKIVAAGAVHNLRRYTLVITGGTRRYEGVTGPLFVRGVSGNGVRRLTFTL